VSHPAQACPVTFEQEAIWLHDRIYDGQSIYLEPWVCRLRGNVDMSAVSWSVTQIVTRHAALHSGIRLEGQRLVQVPRPGQPVAVERLRCPEQSLDAELQRLVRRPVDLRVSPLRVTCVEVTRHDVVLVWLFHHLVVDDWALAILQREFQELYCARVAGRSARLPPLPLQPGEYAAAQRARGLDAGLVDYWRDRLRDAPPESTVPADRPPPEVPSHRGGLVRFGVGAHLAHSVQALARRSRTTPFAVVASAAAVLLRGFNGSDDQVLGTVVSRRGTAGLDQMLTCLTDLLPLPLKVRKEDSFAEVVRFAKRAVSETVAHRDIPFSALVRELGYPRNPASSPLCQVTLVIDDVPGAELNLPGIQAERLYVHPGISKFDLGITLVLDGAGYKGFLVYASDLFTPETAQGIRAGFCSLLGLAVADSGLSIGEILRRIPVTLPSWNGK
jgi:Condensation domain